MGFDVCCICVCEGGWGGVRMGLPHNRQHRQHRHQEARPSSAALSTNRGANFLHNPKKSNQVLADPKTKPEREVTCFSTALGIFFDVSLFDVSHHFDSFFSGEEMKDTHTHTHGKTNKKKSPYILRGAITAAAQAARRRGRPQSWRATRRPSAARGSPSRR